MPQYQIFPLKLMDTYIFSIGSWCAALPFPPRNCLLLPLGISSGGCVGNLTRIHEQSASRSFLSLIPETNKRSFEAGELSADPKMPYFEVYRWFLGNCGTVMEEEVIGNTVKLCTKSMAITQRNGGTHCPLRPCPSLRVLRLTQNGRQDPCHLFSHGRKEDREVY